jgi:hypothetical protein
MAAAAAGYPVPAAKPIGIALSACVAVSPADVKAALGRRVAAAGEESQPGTSTCDYTTTRGRVTVTLQRLAGPVDIAVESAALEHEIEGAKARPIDGIADAAFFLDIPGAGTQLHVIRNRVYLMVSVLGFGNSPHVSDVAERLVRIALSRF